MRIGIDATCWLNRRGFGRFVRELLGALSRLECADEFVLFADRQTVETSELPNGWPVVVAETSTAATSAASADGSRSLADMLAMRKAVTRERLDVFFFPAVYSYFPLGGRVPCIVTFHDVIAETLPGLIFKTKRSRLFWTLKCWLALRRSALVATVSNASKEGLMRRFRLPADRVRILPEAPSPAFGPVDRESAEHTAALARHGVGAGERYVLYAGGISPHKNLGTLISAFAKMSGEPAFADVKLILVGDYRGDVFHGCHAQLSAQVAELGITSKVSFAGFVPDADLAHLYAGARVFVLPSFLEGFGLPVVEAMACGAAVAASHAGSLPEVLDGAGHLFDPHDVGALEAALRQILGDEAYRADLAARGAARARQFSWERSARCALAMFHELNHAGR